MEKMSRRLIPFPSTHLLVCANTEIEVFRGEIEVLCKPLSFNRSSTEIEVLCGEDVFGVG
jgi:hypothetical protein